jgi:hypothetical protein
MGKSCRGVLTSKLHLKIELNYEKFREYCPGGLSNWERPKYKYVEVIPLAAHGKLFFQDHFFSAFGKFAKCDYLLHNVCLSGRPSVRPSFRPHEKTLSQGRHFHKILHIDILLKSLERFKLG